MANPLLPNNFFDYFEQIIKKYDYTLTFWGSTPDSGAYAT